MKRSTAPSTIAVAVAALLGLPAAGWSQATPETRPAPAAQQPAPSAEQSQSGSAQEHLQQAKAALNDLQPAAVPARAKTKITELKRHVSALEKSAGKDTGAAATTTKGKASWSTEVAAIDKILTELLGPATASGTTAPGATGTTGSAATTLDEATRGQLMQVRTHITAFAAAMSGAGAATPGASEPSSDPSAAAAAATTAQPPATSAAQPPASTPPSSAPQSPATSPSPSSSSSSAPTSSSASSAPAQSAQPSPGAEQAQPSSSAAPQANEQEAKQHIMAARNSLSELTQLPAAAQLTGETRTQVSQLISNFNELITTKAEWRASYAKVEANVAALLGPESGAPAQTAETPSPTPGAVGTSGAAAVPLDPAIKSKLVEFREHLTKFEKASGGATDSAATTGSSMTGASTTGAPAASSEQGATSPAGADTADQDSALRHIEAIEAIVSGRDASSSTGAEGAAAGTPGATGTTGATSASGITLDRTKVEQIRMHLAELRKAIEKK